MTNFQMKKNHHFFFQFIQYYDENNNKTKDKPKDVLVKIKQFREMEKLSKNRLYSIPKNATIREESIKCGSQL